MPYSDPNSPNLTNEPSTDQRRPLADCQALPAAAAEGGEGGTQRQAADGSAGKFMNDQDKFKKLEQVSIVNKFKCTAFQLF